MAPAYLRDELLVHGLFLDETRKNGSRGWWIAAPRHMSCVICHLDFVIVFPILPEWPR